MKCRAPIKVKNRYFSTDYSKSQDRTTTVRCGICEGCLKTKITDWAFRLEQEGKVSLHVHFVTLTYSPGFVPLTKNQFQTIQKRDVQLFMKRLRLNQDHGNLKYFACGEYGSNTYRPHYHIILFNCDDQQDIIDAWTKDGKPLGNTHIVNDISNGAIPYTLKYMYKKGLVPAWDEINEETGEIYIPDDRNPEFRIMSQKLGLSYLTPAIVKWHLADSKNRMYVTMKNGINVAMPRYYREKLIKLSNRSRNAFIKDSEEPIPLSTENLTEQELTSRIQRIKHNQTLFEKKRNQSNRKIL